MYTAQHAKFTQNEDLKHLIDLYKGSKTNASYVRS
jgi:hypothetical protein